MNDAEIAKGAFFECAKRELFEETGIWLSFVRNKTIGTILAREKLFYIITINKNILISKPIDKNEIERTMWVNINKLDQFAEMFNCNNTLGRLIHDIQAIQCAYSPQQWHKVATPASMPEWYNDDQSQSFTNDPVISYSPPPPMQPPARAPPPPPPGLTRCVYSCIPMHTQGLPVLIQLPVTL
jgi:hypothetical protein